MEIQLQELIEQIKKDGVEAAEAQAEAIISAAQEQAKKIIADAQVQADSIISNAKSENARIVKSSEDAIRQAGRNLLISFRESVTKELNSIIGDNVSAVYSSDMFTKLIVNVVECWANKSDVDDVSVILNTEDLNALETTLLAALKEKIAKGVTLKANDNFDGGFRIAVNNGSVYYDYSAQEVVDMLSSYLSPKVVALMKEAE